MSISISFLFALLVTLAHAHQSSPVRDHGTAKAADNIMANRTDATQLKPLDAQKGYFSNRSDAMLSLESIYSGHARHVFWKIKNDYHEAVKEIKDMKDEPKNAVLYSEIKPTALMQLLGHIDARPGQNFLDLGSGTGKAVFAAWLLGLNASGVELLRTRWQAACKVAQTSRTVGYYRKTSGPGVSFLHDDLRNVDLSYADIVFVNSVRFSPEMLQQIAMNATGHMKGGSKIISSTGLPGEGFRTDEIVLAPTSSMQHDGKWVIQTVRSKGVQVTDTELLATDKSIHATASRDKSASLLQGQSSSLIRKEPKEHHVPHGHAPEQGPVFGAMPQPEEPSNLELSDTKVCTLQELTSPKKEVSKEAAKATPKKHKVEQLREASKVLSNVDTEVL